MQWYWQIIWHAVPYVVLIPFGILVALIGRKAYNRFRWRRQLVNEIVIAGPSAILAAFPTPKPIFAKSVALTFPDWGGFTGDVELFSGSDPLVKFQVPKRKRQFWQLLIPAFFKEGRGAVECEVGKEIRGNELIARVDGDSHWLLRDHNGVRAKRKLVLRITVFGQALA